MRKLALLLSILVLLVAATGAVSAKKPAPDTFTITGYTINTPVFDYETLPGHVLYSVLAQGGGEDAEDNNFCLNFYGVSCQTLCLDFPSQACGVSGDLNGSFTFEEWIDIDLDELTATNYGLITITTPDHRSSTAVVQFNGGADLKTVWGEFEIEKKTGTGAHKNLEGAGTYAGNSGLVFTVTFTGDLKGLQKVKN